MTIATPQATETRKPFDSKYQYWGSTDGFERAGYVTTRIAAVLHSDYLLTKQEFIDLMEMVFEVPNEDEIDQHAGTLNLKDGNQIVVSRKFNSEKDYDHFIVDEHNEIWFYHTRQGDSWSLTLESYCGEGDLEMFHDGWNPISKTVVNLYTPFNRDIWAHSFDTEVIDGKVSGEVNLQDTLFNKVITKEEYDLVKTLISKDIVDPSGLDQQIQELQPILDKAGVSIKLQTIVSLV